MKGWQAGRRSKPIAFLFVVAGQIGACAHEPRIAADAHLVRPDRIVLRPLRAEPASVNVDTNQFSYVMSAFAYPLDARARAADATAAAMAIEDELAARLATMGFRVEKETAPATGSAGSAEPTPTPRLILEGTLTNITEALPATLSSFDAGQPASQVNARFRLLYQFPGGQIALWQELSAAAPATPSPAEQESEQASPAAVGPSVTYVAPRREAARTAEVAAQARRLADRLAERLRQSFAAQGWLG